MQSRPFMQSDELDDVRRPAEKKSDATAMRILKEWCAKHDGEERAGAVIDREFVVVGPDDARR
jgi:hypothetical protein